MRTSAEHGNAVRGRCGEDVPALSAVRAPRRPAGPCRPPTPGRARRAGRDTPAPRARARTRRAVSATGAGSADRNRLGSLRRVGRPRGFDRLLDRSPGRRQLRPAILAGKEELRGIDQQFLERRRRRRRLRRRRADEVLGRRRDCDRPDLNRRRQ